MIDDMHEQTSVLLKDSDGNTIFAFVSYNRKYQRDYQVLDACVEVEGKRVEIKNLEMIAAQYSGDIMKAICEWENVLGEV